jgi:hypothetical protein
LTNELFEVEFQLSLSAHGGGDGESSKWSMPWRRFPSHRPLSLCSTKKDKLILAAGRRPSRLLPPHRPRPCRHGRHALRTRRAHARVLRWWEHSWPVFYMHCCRGRLPDWLLIRMVDQTYVMVDCHDFHSRLPALRKSDTVPSPNVT